MKDPTKLTEIDYSMLEDVMLRKFDLGDGFVIDVIFRIGTAIGDGNKEVPDIGICRIYLNGVPVLAWPVLRTPTIAAYERALDENIKEMLYDQLEREKREEEKGMR